MFNEHKTIQPMFNPSNTNLHSEAKRNITETKTQIMDKENI